MASFPRFRLVLIINEKRQQWDKSEAKKGDLIREAGTHEQPVVGVTMCPILSGVSSFFLVSKADD